MTLKFFAYCISNNIIQLLTVQNQISIDNNNSRQFTVFKKCRYISVRGVVFGILKDKAF